MFLQEYLSWVVAPEPSRQQIIDAHAHAFFYAVCALVWVTYFYLEWLCKVCGPPIIVTTRVPMQHIIDKMPSARREPCPPIFWTNPHIQFIPWLIQGYVHGYFWPVDFQRLENVTPCGKDRSVLSVYPGFDVQPAILPIIIILPGLRGWSQDCPGIAIVKSWANTKKFRVIVHNRRGHVPEEKLIGGVFHMAGDSDDLSYSIACMRNKFPQHTTAPIFLMGLSLGSALAVTSAGHWDELRRENRNDRYGHPPPENIAGIVLTSAGFDLTKCFNRFPFPYSYIMREALKDHFILKNDEMLREKYGDAAVDHMLKVESLGDFVEGAWRFADCASVEEYFSKYNPVLSLEHFTTPCCLLLSKDDPITVIENGLEISPYPQFKGLSYKQFTQQRTDAMILGILPNTGSHCTFLDGGNFGFMEKLDGLWCLKCWSDTVAIEFANAILEDRGFQYQSEDASEIEQSRWNSSDTLPSERSTNPGTGSRVVSTSSIASSKHS